MRGINQAEDFSWAAAPRSSGGGGTSTSTTSNSPPPQVLANYNQITGQANNVAQTPFPTYNGQLIAGFNPQQQTAFNNVNTAAGAANPFINAASQDATNATSMLSPTNFGGTIQSYQDPYTQQVVGATQAEQNNQNAQQLQQVQGNAASQGALGGDRSAVAQGITAGQQQLAEAPVIANLNNQGFNTALNAAQGDSWLNSQGAFSLGQLGTEAQQTGLTGANAEEGVGSLEQQEAQQQLNLPYEQFLSAEAYPFQETGWQSNIDLGLGSASGGIGSTTTPGPSALSQGVGLATAGAGLAGVANNSGLFGSSSPAINSDVADLAVNDGGAGSGFVDSGSFYGATGGRVTNFENAGGRVSDHYAAGGDVLAGASGIPNLNVQFVPSGPSPNSAGHSMLQPSGSTSNTSGGGASPGQEAQSAIGTAASIAGLVAAINRGGRIGRDAGGSIGLPRHEARLPGTNAPEDVLQSLGGLGALVNIARGARPPMDSSGGRITGLDPVPVHMAGRGFDAGGTPVAAPTQAMFNGNPLATQNFSQYQNLPTEKLHELAARLPPTTPQGQMIQRALQQRQMAPQSDPAQQQQNAPQQPTAQPPQPQQGLAATPPGFADGGGPDMDLSSAGSSWQDDVPTPGAAAGDMPTFDDFVPSDPIQSGHGWHGATGIPHPPIPSDSGGLGSGASHRATGEPLPAGSGGLGAGAAADTGSGKSSALDGPWGTLLATGLGILGGNSPFASENIGKGGLEGLQFGEQQKLREEQQANRMLQTQGMNDYRRALIPINQQKADTADSRANTYAQSAANRFDIQGRTLQLKQQGMDSTTALNQARSEALAQNAATAQQNAGTNQQNAGTRSQALDALNQYHSWTMAHGDAAQADKERMTDYAIQHGATEEDLHAAGLLRNPITGNMPANAQSAAHTLASGFRSANAPAAQQGPMPMPKSAADAVPGTVYSTSRGPARWDGSQFTPVSP